MGFVNRERDVTNADNRSPRKAIVCMAILFVIVTIVLPLYFYFDPTHSHLAPKCIFHTLTGLDCPSCGNQRALHNLLNGEVWLAFRYNPFMWISAPYLLLLIYSSMFKHAQRLYQYLTSTKVLLAYVALYVIWWVVRNLPFWHNIVDLPN